jgi:hypothetical protein
MTGRSAPEIRVMLKRMQAAARADRRSAADWVLLLIEKELDAIAHSRKHK